MMRYGLFRSYAAITVLRETLHELASRRVEGKRRPGLSLPSRIAARSSRCSARITAPEPRGGNVIASSSIARAAIGFHLVGAQYSAKASATSRLRTSRRRYNGGVVTKIVSAFLLTFAGLFPIVN